MTGKGRGGEGRGGEGRGDMKKPTGENLVQCLTLL